MPNSSRPYHPPAQSQEWETPQYLFNQLDAEFHFGLDAAATTENAKCACYYSLPEFDGLYEPWSGMGWEAVWVNPPYGRRLQEWTSKAVRESQLGATVVMLLPSRTGTRWFHRDVLPFAEIRWLFGRLRFEGTTSAAPFDAMICIWRPRPLVQLVGG